MFSLQLIVYPKGCAVPLLRLKQYCSCFKSVSKAENEAKGSFQAAAYLPHLASSLMKSIGAEKYPERVIGYTL